MAEDLCRTAEPDTSHGEDGPFRHSIRAADREVEHLHDIASEGESGATPAILIATWVAAIVPLLAIVIALAFTVAHFATRGEGDSPTGPTSAPALATQPTAVARHHSATNDEPSFRV